ncbi:portal protein, partial [Delftia tsuruhatensis]|uniref:portal protein n=1 Tax=Delftia tsuruhatensis TaxID=180282 RepID=UPI002028D899
MQATTNHGGLLAQQHDDSGEPQRDLRAEFVLTLQSKRREAIAGRAGSGIEEEWTEDEEHYQGIDDANRNFQNANQLYRSRKMAIVGGQPKQQGPARSVVFLNITRPYTDAASARVADMLLPTDDRAWEIKSTPLPRLSGQQLTMLAQAMGATDPAAVHAQMAAQASQAEEAAERMQQAIEDPLVESNWHGEVRQVIEDSARIGSGVLKGPFPITRTARMTRKDPATGLTEFIKVDEIKPGSKRIDVWNFFPDPACGENIHNGSYTWEREHIGRRQIKELLADPSYETAELLAALREGPARTREGTEAVYRPGEDEFEMWIFYGHCAREHLARMGVELEEGDEDRVPTMAVMINDRLVKVVLSPQDDGEFPYDVLAWQRRPGMPWGVGISRQVRTAQRMLNGSARAMMDNAGLSASPQVIIGNGITPQDGNYGLRPGKVWRAEADADASDVRAAFNAFVVPSVQVPLMNIINFALKMAEDTTGMPAMLQGIRGDAPNTLGGMQMQNNNATSVLRRLAKRFDDYMTRPHIQRYFDWMMTYSDDESIKGDFQIDVRASSALVERDAQQQFLMTLLQVSANPIYELDPAKLAAELCKGQRLDPTNF